MLRYITLYLPWFVFYIKWKTVRLGLLTSIYKRKLEKTVSYTTQTTFTFDFLVISIKPITIEDMIGMEMDVHHIWAGDKDITWSIPTYRRHSPSRITDLMICRKNNNKYKYASYQSRYAIAIAINKKHKFKGVANETIWILFLSHSSR